MGKSASPIAPRRTLVCGQRSGWLSPVLGLMGMALPLLVSPAQADVKGADGPRGLGTVVNGVAGGGCRAGLCQVSGGTAAGRNIFFRFSDFDTRGAIHGVRIQSDGYRNVMVGVTSPLGSFIDKVVSLSSRGNLFWLSPGGIQISGGGGFQNIQHLQLSTATGLRFGGGLWNLLDSTADEVAALQDDPIRGSAGLLTDAKALQDLGLQANGDLRLDGGTLTVEESLLLDSQGGNVLLQAAGLQAPGGVVELNGKDVFATNSTVDVSQPDGVGGRVVISAQRVQLDSSRLDASGFTDGGEVTLGAVQELTLTSTDLLARGGSGRVLQPEPPATPEPTSAPAASELPVPIAEGVSSSVVPADTSTAPNLPAPQPAESASAAPVDGSSPAVGPVEPAVALETAEPASVAADLGSQPTTDLVPPDRVAATDSGAGSALISEPVVLPVPTPANALDLEVVPVLEAPATIPSPVLTGRGGRISLQAEHVLVSGGKLDASGGQSDGVVSLTNGSSGGWQQPLQVVEAPLAEVLVNDTAAATATPSVVDQPTPGVGGNVSINAATVVQNARIEVSGSTGGSVVITARETLNSDAPVVATGLEGKGGTISLQAGSNLFQGQNSWLIANGSTVGGMIHVAGAQALESSGRYEALGLGDHGTGGVIELSGASLVLDGISADASGNAGGGVIHVGGGERGADLQLGGEIADTIWLRSGSTLKADAITTGDGGNVIVYADAAASIDANLSVRGGAQGGQGGFVETSADHLQVTQAPRLSASAGRAGTWLIDPTDLRIVGPAGGGGYPTAPNNLAGVSYVDASLLSAALETGAGASVILQTSAEGLGAGDIYIQSPVALATAAAEALPSKLILRAHNSIFIDAGLAGANGRPLDVDFIADSDASGGGSVQWGSATLDLKGGTATVLKNTVVGSELQSTAGDLIIKPSSSATLAQGSALQTGSLSLQSGTLQVDGMLTSANYLQTGGTLSGAGDVILTGSGSWTGGTMTGTGTLRVLNSALFGISAAKSSLESIGDVSYVGAFTDYFYSGVSSEGTLAYSVAPRNGSSMLKIVPSSTAASALTQFLGIENQELQRFTSPESATTGSGLRLNLSPGDNVSFDWFFASVDYVPYYDASFYVASDGVPVSLAKVGDASANQWNSLSFTAPAQSGASLGIGSVNVKDTALNSYILVDNLRVNGQLLVDQQPISAPRILGGGRQIDNQGIINWDSGSVLLQGSGSAAAILNSGTFNVNADVHMGSSGEASVLSFQNLPTGKLIKTAGTGRAALGSPDSALFPDIPGNEEGPVITKQLALVDLTNEGLVDVKEGTLALYSPANSAVSTGTFRAVSTAASTSPMLEFAKGGFQLGDGATLEGNVHVAADASLDLVSAQNLNSAPKVFKSLSLVNDGVVNWTAGGIDINSSVVITNNGVFNAGGSASDLRLTPVGVSGSVPDSVLFQNNGQLVKTSGAGSVYFDSPPNSSVPSSPSVVGTLSGSGLINVETGLLAFTAGALSGGLDLGSGTPAAELRIGSASYVLATPIYWDGGGNDSNWFNDLNWTGDQRPSVSNSVFIGGYDVDFTGGASPISIASLAGDLGSAFTFSAGSLNVLGSVNLDSYQQYGGSLYVGGGFFVNQFALSQSQSSSLISGGSSSGGFIVGGGGAPSAFSQLGGEISGFSTVKVIVDSQNNSTLSTSLQLAGTSAALPATLSARDRLELEAKEGSINLAYANLSATNSNAQSRINLRAFSDVDLADVTISAPAAKFELRAGTSGGLGALRIARSTLNAAAGAQGGIGGEVRGYGSSVTLDAASIVTSGSTTGGKILLGDSVASSVVLTATTLVADPPAATGGEIGIAGASITLGAGTSLNVVGSSGGSLSIGGPATSSVSIASGVILQASPTVATTITSGNPVSGQLSVQVVDLTPPASSAPPSSGVVTAPPTQPTQETSPSNPAPSNPSPPVDQNPGNESGATPTPSPPVAPADPQPQSNTNTSPAPADTQVDKILDNPAVSQAIQAPPLQPVVAQPPPVAPLTVVADPTPATTASSPVTDTATSGTSSTTSSDTTASSDTTDPSASTSTSTSATSVAPVPQGLEVALETGASFELFGDLPTTTSEGLATALLASTGVTLSQSVASMTMTEVAQSLVAIFGDAAFEVASVNASEGSVADNLASPFASSGEQQDAVSAMIAGASDVNADEAVASASASPSVSETSGATQGEAVASGSASESTASESTDSGAGRAAGTVASASQPATTTVSKQEAAASFQSGERKSLEDAVAKLGISSPGGTSVMPTPQQVQTALVRIQQFVRSQLQRNAAASGTR